ncbi:MAG: trehalose-6-phosphate synthase [Acidobacteria bacterium]|nr:trehalose-6-phosphate synthase [Acidobacteriota bacterium]
MVPRGHSAPNEASLVVVSNRLPYDLPGHGGAERPRRNVGGLVNALEPVLGKCGGTWIGWDGRILPNLAAVQAALGAPRARTMGGVEYIGLPLSERELARYYHGYCNRVLWPLLHDFVGKVVFGAGDFEFYERVNRRFAEIAARSAGPAGRVWVHDFHLLLVPGMLRELGFQGRIDFFLHVPFPPPELFRTLPQRERTLASLLAADTLGFHIARYRDNFRASAESLGLARGMPRDAGFLLAHERGRTSLLVAPVGVDMESFDRLARDPAVVAKAARIRAAHGHRPIVFSADRLDYTKGIRSRMLALERLLADDPGSAGRFDLVQVVVPSRHQVEEYRQLKRDIDREVGRINGEYGDAGWMPIHYRYRALEREDLVAHFLAADVCLVTPLRDGFNLVAAEFVASRPDDDGVLICSEFAGVAELLPGALLVNPYDMEAVARAIREALAMPRVQRAGRKKRLREAVRTLDASAWADRCLNAESVVNL